MKNVLLLIEPARNWSQGLLKGIVKFTQLNSRWDFCRISDFYGAPIYSPKLKKSDLATIKEWQADGIITRHIENIDELLKLNIPVVYAGDDKIVPGIPNIITDHAQASKIAAEHLLDKGFSNFAFCGFSDYKWSIEREKAFVKNINDAGYECKVQLHSYKSIKNNWNKKIEGLTQWLETMPKPTGIMTCSDFRSLHVLEACKIAKLNIPEDIAIIGVDNDDLICELSSPPLSSVAINTERAGYEAAEILDKMMDTGKTPEIIIPASATRVIHRQSTDILDVSDAEVAKAIMFIRLNARTLLQVDDVVNVTDISRRSLEQRFKAAINKSIYQEIRKHNVNHICKILAESNMSINDIAIKSGHPTIGNLARYFKQETNMSPSKYRKEFGGK